MSRPPPSVAHAAHAAHPHGPQGPQGPHGPHDADEPDVPRVPRRVAMREAGGSVIAGARSRLLPASVPLRYFAAAVAFHVLAWAAALAGHAELPRFRGGLGWPLAALHAVTLGVVTMTALGASLQLLPVATRRPLRSVRAAALLWWLYTPGVALLTLGMGLARPVLLGIGAAATVLALALWAALLGHNLWQARGLAGPRSFAAAALAALALALASALSLVGAYLGLPGWARGSALALHVVFAAYGFMGLLALGVSHILVPLFALADVVPARAQLASLACAVLALALAAAAAFGAAAQPLGLLAVGAGAAAVALHLLQMRRVLRSGLRRELGRSFVFVRAGWALLAASLAAAAALVLGLPWEGAATLWGLLLVAGWLLTFLLGMLQRIVPFLGAMHASGRGGRRPPTPSALTDERPLRLHAAAHAAALALLVAAVVAGSPAAALAGAAAGLAGALAFARFFAVAVRRMHEANRPGN